MKVKNVYFHLKDKRYAENKCQLRGSVVIMYSLMLSINCRLEKFIYFNK